MGNTIVPAGYAPLVPYRPRFADGVTGGTGGTVSDGGPAGRVTFTLPSSGHVDPGDACFAAWPARDALGGLLPPLAVIDSSGSPRFPTQLQGWASVSTIAAPTAGNGVRVGVAVVAAPTASDVVSTNAHGYAAELDYTATPGVRASRIFSGGWFVSSPATNSSIDKVTVAGDLLQNTVANGHRTSDNRLFDSRYAGNETVLTGFVSEDPLWLVAYAYRTGASVGTEVVTVDVASMLIPDGGPA